MLIWLMEGLKAARFGLWTRGRVRQRIDLTDQNLNEAGRHGLYLVGERNPCLSISRALLVRPLVGCLWGPKEALSVVHDVRSISAFVWWSPRLLGRQVHRGGAAQRRPCSTSGALPLQGVCGSATKIAFSSSTRPGPAAKCGTNSPWPWLPTAWGAMRGGIRPAAWRSAAS